MRRIPHLMGQVLPLPFHPRQLPLEGLQPRHERLLLVDVPLRLAQLHRQRIRLLLGAHQHLCRTLGQSRRPKQWLFVSRGEG